MNKFLRACGYLLLPAAGAALAQYLALPLRRAGLASELVMLGDFNNDHAWDARDAALLRVFLSNPYARPRMEAVRTDVNRNGFIDDEDIRVLGRLHATGDPYKAREQSLSSGLPFPYPRELFLYIPTFDYPQRPAVLLSHPVLEKAPLPFLQKMAREPRLLYRDRLLAEVFDEGLRLSIAYSLRREHLTKVEADHARGKLERARSLWAEGDAYSLLMLLIGLTEDAETLTVNGQTPFVAGTLFLRDHLRALLASPLYEEYAAGKKPASIVLQRMSELFRADLGLEADLENLPPPRDLLKLRNYSDRVLWQYFKSTASRRDFLRLVLFAQHDRRYLRAVARTTPKHADLALANHNLPMILLFREALRIKKGDKRAAVGLLDEAVRVPFHWVKSIPPDQLPSSVALENFLLPGNKEDGPDKSRHWNVFGGISLYKSPEESIRLSLAREMRDFQDGGRAPALMTEFIRDTMANLNGVYYVMSINPRLIYRLPADD